MDSLDISIIAGLLVDRLGWDALPTAQRRAARARAGDDRAGEQVWSAVAAEVVTFLKAETRH